MDVTLTEYEMRIATWVGRVRQREAERRGLRDKLGVDDPALRNRDHALGAGGEMALCKALDVYWLPTVNTFKTQADVGLEWEVRTRSRHDYDLIVRDDDPDRIFVLVTGVWPVFRIHGWIDAADAKRPEYRKNHGGYGEAYFVPQSRLWPIEYLYRKERVG